MGSVETRAGLSIFSVIVTIKAETSPSIGRASSQSVDILIYL